MMNCAESSQIYEVFIQKDHLDPLIHVGSLLAPTDELALQLARENFARRDPILDLWVVSRSCIYSSSQDVFFSREMDRSYREVSGYTENGRLWRMFKEKAISLEEIIQYVDQKQQTKKKCSQEGHG